MKYGQYWLAAALVVGLVQARDSGAFGVGGMVAATVTGGRAMVDYSLAELEERLGQLFVRASRADLVNVSHIEKVASNGMGLSRSICVMRPRSASVAAERPKCVSASAADHFIASLPHCPIGSLAHFFMRSAFCLSTIAATSAINFLAS